MDEAKVSPRKAIVVLECDEVLVNGPVINYSINSQHHTSPDFYWISPLADLLKTLLGNRTCQNSSSGTAIPNLFVCVIDNILNKFSCDSFVFIL